MMKIYFAGSIRGGRDLADLYSRIISYLQQRGDVLTEHIGNPNIATAEQGRQKDSLIYEQDTAWLSQSDVLIAECTCPSLGVGYELAYAERLGKPCHVLYNPARTQLSAMITGNKYYHIYTYKTEEDIYTIIDGIFRK